MPRLVPTLRVGGSRLGRAACLLVLGIGPLLHIGCADRSAIGGDPLWSLSSD